MTWESLHRRSDHNLVLMSEEWKVGEKIKKINFTHIIYKILGEVEIVHMERY